VLLFNHGESSFQVKVGDRIAQIIFERFHSPFVFKVNRLNGVEERIFVETNGNLTRRGEKGFGSSGV
jgi:dUTP pyrophosphatase